jgi:hypothetical protein
MTRELEALREWLQAEGVTHVGMESTGVYWRPVYAVLEGHFDLIVGMPVTFETCRGARPTSKMPSGSPTWSATA